MPKKIVKDVPEDVPVVVVREKNDSAVVVQVVTDQDAALSLAEPFVGRLLYPGDVLGFVARKDQVSLVIEPRPTYGAVVARQEYVFTRAEIEAEKYVIRQVREAYRLSAQAGQ
jgi:hypothetical protein